MKVVKLTTSDKALSGLYYRQTAGRDGKWDNCHYFVNQPVNRCDWWIVCHYSALKQKETTLCDPKHIVYVSMEPNEYFVTEKFLSQFSSLVLCDRDIRHPNVTYRNGLTWWAGIKVRHENGHHFDVRDMVTYDNFNSMPFPSKSKLISIVCSRNSDLPGHHKRLAFLDKLKQHPLSAHIDFFGGGFNAVDDKLDALLPYKYSIALENSVVPDYWSEKLADCYLGYALPIYYGCPNIHDYFSKQALITIDIDNFEQTVSTLEDIIKKDPYGKYFDAILDARHRVLNQYNIFQLMSDICDRPAEKYAKCTLKPSASFERSWPRRMARKYIYKFRGISEAR